MHSFDFQLFSTHHTWWWFALFFLVVVLLLFLYQFFLGNCCYVVAAALFFHSSHYLSICILFSCRVCKQFPYLRVFLKPLNPDRLCSTIYYVISIRVPATCLDSMPLCGSFMYVCMYVLCWSIVDGIEI